MAFLVRRQTTYEVCDGCGCRVEVRHHRPEHCLTHRRVVAVRLAGATLEQVGREIGISRQRVLQIMNKYASAKNSSGSK